MLSHKSHICTMIPHMQILMSLYQSRTALQPNGRVRGSSIKDHRSDKVQEVFWNLTRPCRLGVLEVWKMFALQPKSSHKELINERNVSSRVARCVARYSHNNPLSIMHPFVSSSIM